jgi:hypothetical protein
MKDGIEWPSVYLQAQFGTWLYVLTQYILLTQLQSSNSLSEYDGDVLVKEIWMDVEYKV